MNNTRHLAKSALAIGLVITSFTLFRLTTNILNAILVPLILTVMLNDLPLKNRLIVYFSVYIAVVVLFPTQVVFMLLYIGLAMQLQNMISKQSLVTWIKNVTLFAIALFLATYLTDQLFMLQINRIIFRIVKENVFFLVIFYLIESTVILKIHELFLKLINKRLRR